MDAESEAYVQGAIDNLASEKLTLIIIAHRLATIKNANKESLHTIIFTIAYTIMLHSYNRIQRIVPEQSVCVMTIKIVLLENGSVREEGTFDELLKRDSLFSQFVHRQSLL